jgi:hypothetical protein
MEASVMSSSSSKSAAAACAREGTSRTSNALRDISPSLASWDVAGSVGAA